ncbi:MAG: phosphoribosylamine--glycine ligase [Acidobacteriota bacterium]|nr:phosphoribosylamine--glycine ligase [Acidobacteriota bacterium]
MKILVFGSGGREHALIWKLRESQLTEEIYCAPGNPGIGQEAECLPVDLSDPTEMLALGANLHPDLTVVGPEAPLAAGVVDLFEKAGLPIVGPTRLAAQFESSKIFAKQFMQRHSVPTARFAVAESLDEAVRVLADFPPPVVIKADGLAAGKGVVVAASREEAESTLEHFMRRMALGQAGERVVIEEALAGEEVSFIVLTDGQCVLSLPPSQDHKALLEGDQGPNTGGMGAYSDDAIVSEQERGEIMRRIVRPTLDGMASDGISYRGFLYFGLMLTSRGPQVLEYNVRLGDPEAQPILMRLRTDLAEMLASACDGSLSARDPHWSPNPSVCVVLASKGYPAKPETGQLITGYELAENSVGVKVFHAGAIFRNHQLFTSGGRVLGVTASGEDLESAIQRVYLAVSKIHFEGMQYRRDIGQRGLARHREPPSRDLPAGTHSGIPDARKTC